MGALRQTALVAGTDDPLDNRMRRWSRLPPWVRILVEGDQPIYTAARFKLDRDHWLVRGQEIPVLIDPESPADFEIDWDQVPSIEERAAADDPTLATPIDAHRTRGHCADPGGVAGEGVPRPEQPNVGKLSARSLESGLSGHASQIGRLVLMSLQIRLPTCRRRRHQLDQP